jgi:hypothetical protein
VWLGCPVSTPINSDFLAIDGADFLADMNETIRLRSRKADVAALVVSLAVIAAGSTAVRAAVGVSDPSPVLSATTTSATHGQAAPVPTHAVGHERVELVVDGHIATATLADIPAARQFAAMLPVALDLHDPFGQAKSGALTRARCWRRGPSDRPRHRRGVLLARWRRPRRLLRRPRAAGPAPGLVRLGVVDSGLEAIASAGHRFKVWIDLVDRASS